MQQRTSVTGKRTSLVSPSKKEKVSTYATQQRKSMRRSVIMEDHEERSSEGSVAQSNRMMQLGETSATDQVNHQRQGSMYSAQSSGVKSGGFRQSQSFKATNFRASNAL